MIIIDDTYSITADGNNYILKEKKLGTKQSGKDKGKEFEYLIDVGFFSNVSSAISYLLRKLQREHVAKKKLTLQQTILDFKKIEENLAKKINI